MVLPLQVCPSAAGSLLDLGLRPLHPTRLGVDMLVAVTAMTTRGQSRPTFLSFPEAGDPGWVGRWGGGSLGWEWGCLFYTLSGLGPGSA